jgi:hypothetical protein
MTSQSPRIYLYKITFEEVPYYYYGVHKEKKFDEYYMGTPITHKWCWDFYTPKKQILEIFGYSDEGWLEAQEVEKKLIKPFYNTDKWCLNENCGGCISLEIYRKTGKINAKKYAKLNGIKAKELGVGIFSMSKEERTEVSKRGAETNRKNKTGLFGFTFEERSEAGKIGGRKTVELGAGIHGLTTEEKSKNGKKGGSIGGKKTKENKIGIFAQTKEERSEVGKMVAIKNKENGVSIFALTKEQLSNQGKKTKEDKIGIFAQTKEQLKENGKKTTAQKWMCLETGFITSPGALGRYQKARGIDTSKRVRVD